MDHRPQMRKETRSRQLVVNLEESFYGHFTSLSAQQNVSASALARRLVIRHLMDVGVLPESIVLDTIL